MSPATAAITQMLRVMMRRFIEDNNLLDEEESDDDGDDANGGATILTGGSSGASQRSYCMFLVTFGDACDRALSPRPQVNSSKRAKLHTNKAAHL